MKSGRGFNRLSAWLGQGIIVLLVILFMVVPGGLIVLSGISDLSRGLEQGWTIQAATGALIAVFMGGVLLITGCVFLWKVIKSL